MLEQRVVNGQPQILEWFRNNKGERRLNIIEDFYPYFYVKEREAVPINSKVRDVVATNKKSLFGHKLKKIVVNQPNDIYDIKQVFSQTFEADLSLTDRYRIDIGERKSKSQAVLYFDIETQNDLDVNGITEIISIACYDTISKEYFQFLWRDDRKKLKISKKGNKNLIFATTEHEMLVQFVKYFDNVNPDIISGWNCDFFDLPFLFNRLEKTKIGAGSLSSTGYSKMNKKGVVKIQGRYCFDMYNAYKRIHENNMDSNRLGDVATEELGYGKEGSALDIIHMWKHDLKALIKYNLRDVEILVQLDRKLGLFDFYLMYAEKTNASLEDVFSNSKLVDMYLLNLCTARDIVLPSKTFKKSSGKIQGAKVFDPAKGLKRNIAIMDLKSLYPSIIMSFNMSPETCNGFMDFEQSPKGLLPEALEDLFEERQQLKKQGLDDQQRVVKELMNSFYGVMLFESFRLNNVNIGKSITGTGRNILEWTKKECENAGYDVIYGDTDSVFVEGVKDEVEAKELESVLNKSYDKFVEPYELESHRFEIEFEEFVEIGIFSGKKKKYALKVGENKYKFRGYELRRSNVPRLGREIQKKVLEWILEEGTKEEIKKYINEKKKYIKSEATIDEIGVPASIKKELDGYRNEQHARSARYSNKYLGRVFGKDSKILIMFVKRRPAKFPKTNVIALEFGDELPEGFIIDYDEHIEKVVSKLTDPIFEAVGWRMDVGKSIFDYG